MSVIRTSVRRMNSDFIEDQFFDAIDDVESALRSLGAAPVEHMTDGEVADVLDMLRWVAADMDSFARKISDRAPTSPELAEALRQIDDHFKVGGGQP